MKRTIRHIITLTFACILLALTIPAPAHARSFYTNPECAEQSMRTAPNGSCIRGSKCPVIKQKLNLDGNCVTKPRNYGR